MPSTSPLRPLFQQLLAALEEIAVRDGVSLANVALRLVLDGPQMAAAIDEERDVRLEMAAAYLLAGDP